MKARTGRHRPHIFPVDIRGSLISNPYASLIPSLSVAIHARAVTDLFSRDEVLIRREFEQDRLEHVVIDLACFVEDRLTCIRILNAADEIIESIQLVVIDDRTLNRDFGLVDERCPLLSERIGKRPRLIGLVPGNYAI